MHESLIDYIKNHSTTPLADSDLQLTKGTFVPKRFRKGQFLQQEGEVCKYMAFIIKGAMRQYSVDERGAEHILRLSIENWWAGDRESFLTQTPSLYYVDAWEETDTLVATKSDFFDRMNALPAIWEMGRKLDEKHAFAAQKRLNAAISLSAEERYSDLVKTYPEFLQRFPQHIIASYLGISKETLSRIRHKSAMK